MVSPDRFGGESGWSAFRVCEQYGAVLDAVGVFRDAVGVVEFDRGDVAAAMPKSASWPVGFGSGTGPVSQR